MFTRQSLQLVSVHLTETRYQLFLQLSISMINGASTALVHHLSEPMNQHQVEATVFAVKGSFPTTETSGMRSLHEIPVAGFEVLWMLEGFQLS